MKVPAVLKNKYLFYALAVLATLNVIGYASVKAYECLALFLLAGYGMHCYCKNKSLAILAALFVANFVFGCGRVKEGFTEAMKAPEDLLNDAAEAAEKAGEQLSMQEGNAPDIQACSAISGAALDTAAQCGAARKGGDANGATCDYTYKAEANKCYKDADGSLVADKTDQSTCEAEAGHKWFTSERAAGCA